MDRVFAEIDRVLKDRRYLAVYVSDSWRKRRGGQGPDAGESVFMPIGFELFAMLRERGFKAIDIVAVERFNQKLGHGQWHKAAEEGNFFLRGFNYLMIFKKHEVPAARSRQRARALNHAQHERGPQGLGAGEDCGAAGAAGDAGADPSFFSAVANMSIHAGTWRVWAMPGRLRRPTVRSCRDRAP